MVSILVAGLGRPGPQASESAQPRGGGAGTLVPPSCLFLGAALEVLMRHSPSFPGHGGLQGRGRLPGPETQLPAADGICLPGSGGVPGVRAWPPLFPFGCQYLNNGEPSRKQADF